jgi:hypothetical protein
MKSRMKKSPNNLIKSKLATRGLNEGALKMGGYLKPPISLTFYFLTPLHSFFSRPGFFIYDLCLVGSYQDESSTTNYFGKMYA